MGNGKIANPDDLAIWRVLPLYAPDSIWENADAIQKMYFSIATSEWGQQPGESEFIVNDMKKLKPELRNNNFFGAYGFLRGLERILIDKGIGVLSVKWLVDYIDGLVDDIHGKPVLICDEIERELYYAWAIGTLPRKPFHQNLQHGYENLTQSAKQYDRRIAYALWQNVRNILIQTPPTANLLSLLKQREEASDVVSFVAPEKLEGGLEDHALYRMQILKKFTYEMAVILQETYLETAEYDNKATLPKINSRYLKAFGKLEPEAQQLNKLTALSFIRGIEHFVLSVRGVSGLSWLVPTFTQHIREDDGDFLLVVDEIARHIYWEWAVNRAVTDPKNKNLTAGFVRHSPNARRYDEKMAYALWQYALGVLKYKVKPQTKKKKTNLWRQIFS